MKIAEATLRAMEQIIAGSKKTSEMSQSISAAAEEMSSATVELSGLAQRLQAVVEQFTLGADVERALPAAPAARAAARITKAA